MARKHESASALPKSAEPEPTVAALQAVEGERQPPYGGAEVGFEPQGSVEEPLSEAPAEAPRPEPLLEHILPQTEEAVLQRPEFPEARLTDAGEIPRAAMATEVAESEKGEVAAEIPVALTATEGDEAPASLEPREEARVEEATAADQEPKEEARVEEAASEHAGEPELEETGAEPPADIEEIGEGPPVVESPDQAKRIIEALLFASGEPVSARRLANALGVDTDAVHRLATQLADELTAQGRGIQVVEVAGWFQVSTRPEMAEWILRLLRHRKRSPLSPAALETLAIIAYKQPIIRAEIEAIRGVESGGVVRTLLDLGLIEIKGRKEILGRPQMFGTTDAFLRAFGLRRLEDLPSIQELRERYQLGSKPSGGKHDSALEVPGDVRSGGAPESGRSDQGRQGKGEREDDYGHGLPGGPGARSGEVQRGPDRVAEDLPDGDAEQTPGSDDDRL
ncbi:MAG: SMC-Scp complex subunit ScpB [Candidatus Sumerlaeota bacterium]|nr:SMC-Scp complex subunit ScpB [Candidatus Sumerlaeota bacterium]